MESHGVFWMSCPEPFSTEACSRSMCHLSRSPFPATHAQMFSALIGSQEVRPRRETWMTSLIMLPLLIQTNRTCPPLEHDRRQAPIFQKKGQKGGSTTNQPCSQTPFFGHTGEASSTIINTESSVSIMVLPVPYHWFLEITLKISPTANSQWYT